ncbi:MAG: ribbon-helix-helix protein, CopG family [Candidatus Micrarchaeia archaeon]
MKVDFKNKKKNKIISLRVDEDLLKRIEKYKEDKKISKSQAIRELIELGSGYEGNNEEGS